MAISILRFFATSDFFVFIYPYKCNRMSFGKISFQVFILRCVRNNGKCKWRGNCVKPAVGGWYSIRVMRDQGWLTPRTIESVQVWTLIHCEVHKNHLHSVNTNNTTEVHRFNLALYFSEILVSHFFALH